MPNESVSRREFTKKLAAGAVAVPLTAGGAKISEAVEKDAKQDKQKKKQQKPKSEAGLLLELVGRRYPSEHLDEKILDEIHDSLVVKLARGEVLGSYPLKNADEPGFVFSAYRRDGTR